MPLSLDAKLAIFAALNATEREIKEFEQLQRESAGQVLGEAGSNVGERTTILGASRKSPEPAEQNVQVFKHLSIMTRWAVVATLEGLKKDSRVKEEKDEYYKRKSEFIAQEVNDGFLRNFGSNANRFEGWKSLCWTIGITSHLASVEEYRRVRICNIS